jgi:hypothetical protein
MLAQHIKFERVWAMPNHKTFEIKPIKQLIQEELGCDYVDPFPYPYEQDALDYLKTFSTESIEKLVFDPPYSQRQLREMYNNAGLSLTEMNNGYWSKLRDEISRTVKPGGKVISFGWNSAGINLKRGFEITRILLVAHGSQHNDTICTVEIKTKTTLQSFRSGK